MHRSGEKHSRPGDILAELQGLCRKDAPATYMDFAEVQFIFAEAALKGLITEGLLLLKLL
jgi:hypothetical protein